MEDKNTFVLDRIRRARLGLKLHQEDVAKVLGISTSAYSNIERGEAELSPQRYKTLCEFLKLEIPDELLPTSLQENPYPALDPKAFQTLVINALERVTALEKRLNQLDKPSDLISLEALLGGLNTEERQVLIEQFKSIANAYTATASKKKSM